MQLPWVQIANEVIEQAAADVAVALDEDELRILGGLVKFFRWAVGRCADHMPPSASAVVVGPTAAKLIALKAGYRGDAEAFVTACQAAQPSILERVPEGIRIRGLDRYDSAWGKSHPEAWAKWKKEHPKQTEAAPEPKRNRTGSGPVQSLQIETQIQTQKQKTKLPPPPDPESAPPESVVVGDEDDRSPEKFWRWAQRQRAGVIDGAMPENRPDDYAHWAAAAMTEAGPWGLSTAYGRFLADPHWQAQGCPFAKFMSPKVWRPRVGDPPPARDSLTGVSRHA